MDEKSINFFLFHRHALREIPWFVDIATESVCHMIGEELKDDHFRKNFGLGEARFKSEIIVIDIFFGIITRDNADNFPSSRFHLLNRTAVLAMERRASVDDDGRKLGIDERE